MEGLTQALAKLAGDPGAPAPDYNQRVDHVADEIADVRIMLHQLCMILNLEEKSVQFEYQKLARLNERLREAQAEDVRSEGLAVRNPRAGEAAGAGRNERLKNEGTDNG